MQAFLTDKFVNNTENNKVMGCHLRPKNLTFGVFDNSIDLNYSNLILNIAIGK